MAFAQFQKPIFAFDCHGVGNENAAAPQTGPSRFENTLAGYSAAAKYRVCLLQAFERIRSLSGEQLIVSNSDLLNSRIHNFKQFRERRVVFRVGVVYQTPRALVEQIPVMLREAVEEQATARFDRAHFCEFGDYALTFEVVYYVLSPDFAIYMDTQQEINLGIHRRFEAAGVSFAYPTQELILRRGPASMTIAGAAP